MDALKRAEKAREAQAEQADARAADDGGSPELSLDPIEELDSAAPDTPATPPAGSGTEDSLELTPDDVKRQIESMEDSSLDKLVGDTGGLELERSQALPAVGAQPDDSLSLEYGDLPLDDTGSTLPSVRAAQRSVQDYFDGTHSMSMSMEEVRDNAVEHGAPASADEPRADAETQGDTTSRRRAQAVIDARVHAPSHTARNIALVLIVLVLIGGVGGGAFLYKDRIMAMLDAQPPLVAQRRPGTSPAVAASNAVRTPALSSAGTTESLAAAEREALLRAAELARAEEATQAQAQADTEARVRAEVEMRVREIADAAAAQARIEAEAEVLRQAAAEQAASAAAMQGVQRAGVLQDTAVVAPAAFQISRRRGPRRVHKNLVRAFDAFQRGDDGQAMKIYQAVLKREPRNRDAMLGAAAISLRAGATDQAAGYYMEVLRRNPRDGAAQAGLIALQDNLDPISGESRVKELLEHSPGDANLYFSLGNLYAEQGRWPEAQQAYFEAYRLDDANPDYAFNLAVSLDQLAQSRPALVYYRRAEELAGEFPATFDPNVARLRAAELAGL